MLSQYVADSFSTGNRGKEGDYTVTADSFSTGNHVEKKGTTLSQYVADSFSTGNHVEEKGTTLSQYVALSFGTVDSNYPIQALGATWK